MKKIFTILCCALAIASCSNKNQNLSLNYLSGQHIFIEAKNVPQQLQQNIRATLKGQGAKITDQKNKADIILKVNDYRFNYTSRKYISSDDTYTTRFRSSLSTELLTSQNKIMIKKTRISASQVVEQNNIQFFTATSLAPTVANQMVSNINTKFYIWLNLYKNGPDHASLP